MGGVCDLVMPKLGLTMTEGRIARWAFAPGARFDKGACVVEIETDKIVNEVEAPADGWLIELVVAVGETVPVATVIARWRLDDGAAATTAPALAPAGRIIATPYARRLAREAGIDVATLAGSGANGRIKAADVMRLVVAPPSPRTNLVLVPPPPPKSAPLVPHPSPVTPPSISSSLIVVDIDAARLIETEQSLQRGVRRIGRAHLAVLAVLRALERVVPDQSAFRLAVGLEHRAVIDAAGGLSSREVLARLETTIAATSSGDIIVVETPAARVFTPAVPAGWSAVLGIGGVREVPRRDRSSHIIWGYELSLALTYDAGRLAHTAAAALIDDIAKSLADPLHLLAS